MGSRFLTFSLIILTLTATAFAGQMSSHIYTAVRTESMFTGKAKSIVTAPNAEQYYLAGAQGPDVIGVIMPELDKITPNKSAGSETHYSPLKAHLALSILDNAKIGAERAYAIGWITHYLNDIYVHQVVNQYGGFYAIAPLHHKELEQLETLYVMTKHADVVTPGRIVQNYGGLPPGFTDFIFAGFRKTYAQSEIYSNETPEYFNKRYNEAGFWCSQAHLIFWGTASHPERKGVHQHMLGYIIPNMPSADDIQNFLNAVEITEPSATPEKVNATIRIHDNKCYGRFLADWEVATKGAIASGSAMSVKLSAYLNAPAGTKKQELRKKLLAAIPSKNLDQPLDNFMPVNVIPGDKTYRKPYYVCRFWPEKDPNNVKEVSGRCDELTIKSTNWSGSEDGEVALEIPVPTGMSHPYCYELKVATIGKLDFIRPDYEKRSWFGVSGKSQLDPLKAMKNISQIEITLTYRILSNPAPQQQQLLRLDYYDDNYFSPVKSNDWQWNGRQFTMKLHAEDGDPKESPFSADVHNYDIEAYGQVNAAGTRLENLSIVWRWDRKIFESWTNKNNIRQHNWTEKIVKLADIPLVHTNNTNWQGYLPRKDIAGHVLAASIKSGGYTTSGKDTKIPQTGCDDNYISDKYAVDGITVNLQANPKYPLQP